MATPSRTPPAPERVSDAELDRLLDPSDPADAAELARIQVLSPDEAWLEFLALIGVAPVTPEEAREISREWRG